MQSKKQTFQRVFQQLQQQKWRKKIQVFKKSIKLTFFFFFKYLIINRKFQRLNLAYQIILKIIFFMKSNIFQI